MIRLPHQAKDTDDEVVQLHQAQWNVDAAKKPPSNQAKWKGDGVLSPHLLQSRKDADEARIRPSRQAN
jgi:hypothetical protein